MSTTNDPFSQFGPNSGYIRELYQLYLTDPSLVDSSWATYFAGLNGSLGTNGHVTATNGLSHSSTHAGGDPEIEQKIYRLVSAYRNRGHLEANINPLETVVLPLPAAEDLNVDYYDFQPEQLSQTYPCPGFAGRESMQLSELIQELRRVYCGSVGFEFTHLSSQEERAWLQERIEARFRNGYQSKNEQKIRHLHKMIDAEEFESELHKKYIGQKRFSLQGGETTIAMLGSLLEEAATHTHPVKEVVMGMAHRGRLNVLSNIVGKSLHEVFSEFEDKNLSSTLGSGDVKYHLGYISDYQAPTGESVRLSLAPNPSHLEFVSPVVEGIVRAKQDREYGFNRQQVLPVLLHGDAAFVGQGVVPETLHLSGVEGFTTGGTIHLVINNQIGFTTNPDQARSSPYCSDAAKAVQAPVFHINCEDVESACWATKLALEFRQEYGHDVVLDLYCYRKYGHNEGDDPSFTQPLVYAEIKKKKSIAQIYGQELVESGVVTQADIDTYIKSYRDNFDTAYESRASAFGDACATHGRLRVQTPETGVSRENLDKIANSLLSYPDDFVVHPKLHKILKKRVATLGEGGGIDWGFAEGLALGSLVKEGYNIRLCGQDVGRGTFSQRHLELWNYESPGSYWPFKALTDENDGEIEIINSTLSEAGVVGFEFGYASTAEKSLVVWEAQFGDFANGAQVAIDQFISSSEAKWNQRSGLTMMLPHGYEGQGPEHSSARLERYLQLCAEGNMVVCYPTTAAQHFHLLRRQGLLTLQRPLIIMTPKSLLRFAGAAAETAELVEGQFNTILETDFVAPEKVEHVFLTSGKVYYDVLAGLKELDNPAAKVIRVEQLYPFPQYEIKKALKPLTNVKTFNWVQEEPRNMGAWTYMEPYFRRKLAVTAKFIGRPVSASTAAGSSKRHFREQKAIVDEVLEIVSSS